MLIFYVYEHWRLDTNTCFWVGKGSGNRAFRVGRENIAYTKIVTELAEKGAGFEVRFVAKGLSEPEAFALETSRISFWKNQQIGIANRNLISGPGTFGRKLTEEHKAKIAASNIGKQMSAETRAKMSAAQSNRSPETRAKLSSALTGRTLTPEHIAKLKAAVRPPHTEEHKAKMREGQARRAPRTPEHKARIAAAITAWHAQRKQEQ